MKKDAPEKPCLRLHCTGIALFGMMAGTLIGMIAGLVINAEIMIYTLAAGTVAGYMTGLLVYLILHHRLNSRDQSDL